MTVIEKDPFVLWRIDDMVDNGEISEREKQILIRMLTEKVTTFYVPCRPKVPKVINWEENDI